MSQSQKTAVNQRFPQKSEREIECHLNVEARGLNFGSKTNVKVNVRIRFECCLNVTFLMIECQMNVARKLNVEPVSKVKRLVLRHLFSEIFFTPPSKTSLLLLL